MHVNSDTFWEVKARRRMGCMADPPMRPAEAESVLQAARNKHPALVALASDAAAPLAAERQQIIITVKHVRY